MKAIEIKAIENTIELWKWLEETGEKFKENWGGWKHSGGTHPPQRYNCFLCEYVKPNSSNECLTKCLYGKTYGRCATEGRDDIQPFDKWVSQRGDTETRRYWAGVIVRQLQGLLPDKFKVGDRVKILDFDNAIGVVSEIRPPERQWHYGVDTGGWRDYPCHESELEFAPPEVKEIKRVYVAGALSTLPPFEIDNRTPSKVVIDYIANCSKMAAEATDLLRMSDSKLIPYVPMLDFLLGFWDGALTEEQYRAMSSSFLEVCDAMLVVSDSRGVQAEIKKAEKLGIPVFREVCDLIEHYKTFKEVK